MNIFKKSITFPLIFLLLLSFTILSCKKNVTSGKSIAETLSPDSEPVDKNTLVFGSNRVKNIPDPQKLNEQIEFTDVEQGDIKGQLFPLIYGDIIPEDMNIGPLLDFNDVDVSSGTFPSAVISFFMEAKKGIINEDVIAPSFIEIIKRLYADNFHEQSYTLRIGKVFDKNNTTSVKIRLIGKIGRVSGNITAEKIEDKWLLNDISIDMEQLKNDYLREVLEFNPLSYSNILLNY